MKKPNIVFIMTDHTNAQAVAAGSPCLKPNLDALAADGMRFGRCYTTNAICSPARASLMTGTYPSTHGIWDCTHTQRREWVDLPRERLAHFAQGLEAAGYRTGYFGKWHVEQSNALAPFGWQESDLRVAHAPMKAIPGTEVMVPKKGYRDYRLAAVAEDVDTHPAFDRGLDFIGRHAGRGPFCCFISTSEPHDPYVPPKRWFDLYDEARTPLSPTLRDACADKPEVVRRMRSVWESMTEKDWRRATTAYRATISFLDSQVGRVIEALKAGGLYDDTIVVFMSDHGDMLGGHGLVAKGVATPYEEVYNIPLIIRAPGMAGGREETRCLAGTADIGPTLLDLCGLPPLPAAQGRSLRPVLEGTADPAPWQEAYAEFYGQRFVYTQRIVWHGDWKYVFSPGGVDELYNLADDPHERVNLAGDLAHRATLEAMCGRMWRRMEAIGDDSLLKTEYATLRTAPVGPAARASL